MKKLLIITLLLPIFSYGQKFLAATGDERSDNKITEWLKLNHYKTADSKADADYVINGVYEQLRNYMSFKMKWQFEGFLQIEYPDGEVLAKTEKKGGSPAGINGFNAKIDIVKRILKNDFKKVLDSTVSFHKPLKTVQAITITSKADDLTKLKKLLDDGVLTKEEFEAEKKKILDN